MESVLFLQKFTVLDYAYLSPTEGIQGDSLHVSVEVQGTLNHQGFVMDFSKVKKVLKEQVDELFDHKLLVPGRARALRERSEKDGAATLRFGELTYESPAEAVAFLDGDEITPELIAKRLSAEILPLLPKTVMGLRFHLEVEDRVVQGEPSFRYTHGLRFHDGNCQRLIHGHRNVIEVLDASGDRMPEREQELAALFSDIHFVAAETLENRAALDLPLETRLPTLPGFAKVAYRSGQGEFRAEIPARNVMLLETEPSVENLAALAARILQRKYPGESFSVRAYEGIQKGAVAYN